MNSIFELLKKIWDIVFGASDGFFYALVVFVALDYITGICVAIHEKKLSSNIGAKGIAKKVMIFVLVSVAHIIDKFILQSGDTLRILTTVFYLANEGISILENAGKIGVPLPDKLKESIQSIKEMKNLK